MSKKNYEKQIEILKKKIRETTEKENKKVGEIVRKFYIEILKKKIRETTEKENKKVGEIVRKFYDENFENFDIEKFKETCKKIFSE